MHRRRIRVRWTCCFQLLVGPTLAIDYGTYNAKHALRLRWQMAGRPFDRCQTLVGPKLALGEKGQHFHTVGGPTLEEGWKALQCEVLDGPMSAVGLKGRHLKLSMGLSRQNAGRANDVIPLMGLSWQYVRRASILKLSMDQSRQKAGRADEVLSLVGPKLVVD